MDSTQKILASCFCLIGFAYSASWNYDAGAPTGPDSWKDNYPKCAGKRQSPIDIITSDVQYEDLPKIQFGSNWDLLLDNINLTLSNNGHTAVVNIVGSETITTTQGGKTWNLAQFHLHWGTNVNTGSEHKIDGKFYPAEVHFVHFQSTYPNLGAAVPQPDGLMVLGFFIKVDSNALVPSFLQLIMNGLDDTVYKGDEKLLATSGRSLYDMFHTHSTTKYFHYPGSLTTPTCDESVTWNVMHPDNGWAITPSMMNKLKKLSQNKNGETLKYQSGNYRPVLPLHGRVVKRNFDKSSASTIGSILSFTIPMLAIAIKLSN